MSEQAAPTQEVEYHSVEFVLRHIIYTKLQKNGFYPTGLLKSGKAVGGGMINENELEVACGFADGVPSIHIFLPVGEGVREDKFFRRTNAGGRSVLVSYRSFPDDECAFESAESIKQMVEECWPDIDEIIKHGEMILHYNKDKIYPDFIDSDARVQAREARKKDAVSSVQVAIVGSILGAALTQEAAFDVLNFLSTHSLDAPDGIKEYMLMFSRYPALQRALSAAFIAGIGYSFLMGLKDGIVKVFGKSSGEEKKK